jgi:hypothetical protein
MAGADEKTMSEAEFRERIDDWKERMTPQLVQAAKDTAAKILENYADAIAAAEIKGPTPEAREAVEAALAQAAQMARDMATQLRNQTDEQAGPAEGTENGKKPPRRGDAEKA